MASCLALVALIAVAATPRLPLRAQSAESAIVGVIRDSAGTAIVAVTVEARNRATGNVWTLRSSSDGRFAFVQLPLGGPYDITARRLGYRSETRQGYTLSLSQRITVEFTLHASATQLAPVAIAALRGESQNASVGGNTRVDAAQIAAIPAQGRSFTDLVSLSATSGVQLSLLGQRWTSTDIRIDGMQSRNMLRAGEFGAGPLTLSLEAIREFDISTSVYDVAQGRQGGGTVRAATQMGTNNWLGSVFSYYRGSGLSAASDFQSRSRALRQFDAVQWGVSIGGPIRRDRAHVFLAFDRQDSNEPLFNGLIQSAADERSFGVARDSLNRLVGILARSYALDTSRTQIGRLERRPSANSAFARVDVELSPVHHLTLSHNLNAWDSPLTGGVDLPIALFESRSNYESLEHQSLARLRSTWPSGVQNDLSLGASVSKRTLTPNSSLPRGFVRIQSRLADGSAGDTRIQFGGNRLAPDDSRETEWQLIDHLSLQRGSWLYTAGTDNSLTKLSTYIAEAQGGLFEFQSLADLEALRPFRYSRTLPLVEARPRTQQRVLEVGAFLQAEWHPRRTLTTTAGLRWDGTSFLNAPPRNALVEQVLDARTDRRIADWRKIQPRAQLVWDIGGKSRDLVRIGGGRFAAQPIYYLQHNQLLNDGTRIADITRTGAMIPVPDYTAYRSNPSSAPGLAPGSSAPAPYVNLVDAAFRTPSVWKASATYSRAVGRTLSLTTTVLASRTTGNYMYIDRNLRGEAAFTVNNEANRPVFVAPNSIDAQGRTLNVNALANPQLGRVLELKSAAEARDRAVIVEASWRLPRDARMDISYTHNRAEDNSSFGCCLARTATTFTSVTGDPRSLSTSWGSSDLDFRHKWVVAGTLPAVWGVRIGGRYVGSNGRPLSAIVNGDINGDEATSNDLAFVFDPDDPSTPSAVAVSMRKVLSNPRNVARTYLTQNLGRIAPRNGAFTPWTARIDVRAERELRTRAGQAIAISLDIFNVANLLNSAWGAEYQLPVGISNQNPVVQRVPLLNVVGFNQATRQYTYTVNENFGVLQKAGNPYQMQLALRYKF